MTECRFCEIVNCKEHTEFDYVIYETSNFVVTPTKGGFVKGYVLILSKRHKNSMLLFDKNEKDELVGLVDIIRRRLEKKFSFSPLIFEHGDTPEHSELSANSIVHAHIHVIPHKLKDTSFLRELKMNKMDKFENYLEQSCSIPYLMFCDNDYNTYYKNIKEKTESQLFRKIIANDAKMHSFWNWKEHDFIENISETVKIYKEIFYE